MRRRSVQQKMEIIYYVRCMFTWMRRNDASSLSLADCDDDQVQWQQPFD